MMGRAVRWRELWVELGKKNYPERSGTTQSEAELPRAQRNYPDPPLAPAEQKPFLITNYSLLIKNFTQNS